jgi:hypothetical protein
MKLKKDARFPESFIFCTSAALRETFSSPQRKAKKLADFGRAFCYHATCRRASGAVRSVFGNSKLVAAVSARSAREARLSFVATRPI